MKAYSPANLVIQARSWPRERLGNLADHRLGKMLDKAKNTGSPRLYLRNPNIRWFDVKLDDLQEILVEEKDVARYALVPGDVLICEGGEAGRAAIWKDERTDIIFQKACHRVRVGPRLDARFLVHRLFYDYYNNGLDDYYTGATIKHFTGQDLARYEIPLPPLDEQRRIAAILDKADALRRQRKQALALLDGLKQSIFLDMFGDPLLNPKRWPVRPLADFEKFLTSGSRGWAQYYADYGRAFIRIGNLKGGEVDTDDLIYVSAPDNAEARRTLVEERDLLISITADLGRVAVVPRSLHRGAHINQHLALVRIKGLNPYFAAHFLAGNGGRRQFDALNRQGVKAGLNFDNIRSLAIFVPPAPLQDAFVDSIERIERVRRSISAALVHGGTLFSSLQRRAFAGQL